MRLLFCLVACLVAMAQAAQAETLVTTVVGALEPDNSEETWFFLLSAGGRSLRVQQGDRVRVEQLKAHVGKPSFLHIEFTDLGDYDRVDLIEELPSVQSDADLGYLPIEPAAAATDDSILKRVDFPLAAFPMSSLDIFNYFKTFRLARGSQCFHRAYYWGHQLWRQTGILSHKVFMFYTPKYQKKFKEKWWFHVAPFVYENGQEVVLDATYAKKPMTLQQWSNWFLKKDPVCPTVETYEGYFRHHKDQWCYFVKAPMWQYHPNSIERHNKGEHFVKGWDKGWLKLAKSSRRKPRVATPGPTPAPESDRRGEDR